MCRTQLKSMGPGRRIRTLVLTEDVSLFVMITNYFIKYLWLEEEAALWENQMKLESMYSNYACVFLPMFPKFTEIVFRKQA